MTLFQAIFLGILQGLTEFLPVSSSGHLVLAQKFFNLQAPPIFFDALIHFATLLAIIFYLRKDLAKIIFNLGKKEYQKMVILLAVGTIPAVFAGLLLEDSIEKIFNSLTLVGISFLITSVILAATIFIKKSDKKIKEINWLDALFVGFFQAIAILPGVSRSGSTISAGIFRNFSRETAFKFSFLLAIPVIFGATVLQFFDGELLKDGSLVNYFAGFFVAAVFGFLALKILDKILIRGKFYWFAVYCFILGLLTLLF